MRVRNLVLTVVAASAVATVGGCGAVEDESTGNNPDRVRVITVDVNGTDVTCVTVVKRTGALLGIDCDFEGARLNDSQEPQ